MEEIKPEEKKEKEADRLKLEEEIMKIKKKNTLIVIVVASVFILATIVYMVKIVARIF